MSSLSRLAVAIALGVSMQAAQAEEEAKELGTVTVVGDWLGEADQAVVQNHPGARSVVRRREMLESGAQNVRDVLRKVPGVQVQDNNGTGGSDISLNVGVRGLTSRLSPRSTVMIDGVPAAVAPYGQPQLSMMPLSIRQPGEHRRRARRRLGALRPAERRRGDQLRDSGRFRRSSPAKSAPPSSMPATAAGSSTRRSSAGPPTTAWRGADVFR
ncbi:TonB-dependent receptor plug domain-containing protein [Pseudomonas aeruginosa]